MDVVTLKPARSPDRDLVLPLISQLYEHESIEFALDRVGPALDRLLAQPDWGTVLLIQPESDPQPDRPSIAGYALLAYLYSLELAAWWRCSMSCGLAKPGAVKG